MKERQACGSFEKTSTNESSQTRGLEAGWRTRVRLLDGAERLCEAWGPELRRKPICLDVWLFAPLTYSGMDVKMAESGVQRVESSRQGR